MLPEFRPNLSPEDKRRIVEGLEKSLEVYPELQTPFIDKGKKLQGVSQLVHQFERRLKRSLTESERQTLEARFDGLNADRLGDVVIDLKADELVAWLADPRRVERPTPRPRAPP